MFQIPQHVLEKLKCSVCDGFLSSEPLMVKAENEQVCGKCYNILPSDEREKCARQIGLEALGKIMIFPCRYVVHGCTFTFALGSGGNHEEDCQYRYTSLSRISSLSPSCSVDNTDYNCKNLRNGKNQFNCQSDQLKAEFAFELKENKYSKEFKNLTYTLSIQGHYGKSLALKNKNTSETQNDIKLFIEGAVSLGNIPEIVYSDIKLQPAPKENIYESINRRSLIEKHCFNCQTKVYNEEHSCLFGHISCANCKGSMCVLCLKLIENNSKRVCKNYQRGCKDTFHQSDINRHQMECPYNDIKCPLTTCNFKDMLVNIKTHLLEDHEGNIHLSNEVTRRFQNKDETVIVICYENIFKCVYFYYKSFVEFFVTYMGSTEEAMNYKYEISVQSPGKSLTRKSKCCSWNESMLEKGIYFERKELVGPDERKLNFEINLRIIHIK